MLAGCALAGLAASAPVPGAAAKEGKPPAPPRGWVVDRVRFENLAPDGFLQAPGPGDVRGVLDVVPGPGGVAVVNELSLDDYLRGVAEVPSTWPVEALRAQAIAARTFALHEMRKDAGSAARGVGADICASQSCQVYIGMAKERSDGGDRWVQAVQATSGQVLLYKDEPILAQYSSSNGGRSVAGGRPYLKGAVNDPDSARGPYGHWVVTLGYGQLTSVFGLPAPLASLRRTGDTVILDWTAPGGTTGRTEVPVQAFRDRLNDAVPAQGDLPRAVPSTQFSVLADDQSGTATLDGRGHGHGIGLSQFGALGKATRGLRAADILASYYGGLRPVALAADRLPPAIRVALDTGGAANVGGTGRFRVLDGAGAPLAVAANGTWRVTTAGRGKVRVIPPVDQESPPSLADLTAAGPDVAGRAGEARFSLASAALVQVRVEGAALSAPADTAPALVEPGNATLGLPPLPGPGAYTVTVAADAGAGRVTRLSVPLSVRSSVPAVVRRSLAGARPAADLPRPAAVAFGLLGAVIAALRRALDDGTGPPLRLRQRTGAAVS